MAAERICTTCNRLETHCICSQVSLILRSWQKVVDMNWRPVVITNNVIKVDFKKKERVKNEPTQI